MKIPLAALLGLLAIFPLAVPSATPVAESNRWQSLPLWRGEILEARLHYLTPASLTDESILYVEFENRTAAALQVGQAFMNLDGDRNDPVTGETRRSGGVTAGVLFHGRLGPGITTVSGPICFSASESLGLPPRNGYRVEMTLRCEARLDDGRVFATPDPGIAFRIDWNYPDAAGLEALKPRLRALLETPERLPEQNIRLQAILKVPEVADTLTVDDAIRYGLNAEIARRFLADPKVVAHFTERLNRGDPSVLADFGNSQLWNPAWVEPLVANFEKRGDPHTLSVLGWHRDDWVKDGRWNARLSAALLRFRPLLARDRATLGTNELFEWCGNAREAALIGDPALMPRFVPALDDRRLARHPKERFLANFPRRDRVCDAALITVLTLLDGSPLAALKEAGAAEGTWPADVELRAPLFDRAIAQLKERLRLQPIPTAPGPP